MKKAVIGLDIGTSSIKVIICNYNNQIIYSDKEKLSEKISNKGIINPQGLLDKIITILSRTISKNKEIEVKAIGVSSLFPSLIALDNKGGPLTKILTWVDNRAYPIIKEFKKDHKKAKKMHENTGCIIHESYSLWKILWIKKHKKEVFLKTDKFISLSEYLTYKLTGKFLVSRSIASTTGMYNIFSEEWDESILDMIEINKKRLSNCYEIYHSEEIVKELCSKIGLKEKTTIVLGAGDGILSHIGSGCMKEKIMSSTIGTSGALRLISNKPITNKNSIWCYYLDKNKYILGNAINAGWKSINWFKKGIIGSSNDDFFKMLDEKMIDIPIDGPIFLPFLDGERGPNYNQNMVASFMGLKSNDNNLSIYKSIIEGIFFNLYSCYETIVEEVGKPLEIHASGGYIHSDVMLQIQSDIFNEEIYVPNIQEASALGAAIIALRSINKITNISNFKIEITKVFYPNTQRNKVYMKRYEKYKKGYKFLLKFNKNSI